MNITLTPDLEQIVTQTLEGGRYHSVSEVIGASLHLLQAQETLRREIALGIEQADRGMTRPFDADDLKRRVRDAWTTLGVTSRA